MNEAPTTNVKLEEFLLRLGTFKEQDLTQDELDGIIKFYHAHGLDRLTSLDDFFEQMK